jgi:hypothetical protein
MFIIIANFPPILLYIYISHTFDCTTSHQYLGIVDFGVMDVDLFTSTHTIPGLHSILNSDLFSLNIGIITTIIIIFSLLSYSESCSSLIQTEFGTSTNIIIGIMKNKNNPATQFFANDY